MAKVKICGNTNVEDAKLAAAAGADYLGFIFTESKRRVSMETAQVIMRALPDFKNFVGVFFNRPKQEVEAVIDKLGLRIVQFHGEEPALYCKYFMDKGCEVIKTFRVKDAMSLKRIDEYNVSAFLFDTFSKEESGGTGKPFDWEIIRGQAFIHDRFFLAGGLNIQNLHEALQTLNPYAVDVASGVEREPGRKDPVLLQEFIRIAKEGKSENAKTPCK